MSADADLPVLGPLARTAADLALALDVLAGPGDREATAYRLALPPSRHSKLEDFRVLVMLVWRSCSRIGGRICVAGVRLGSCRLDLRSGCVLRRVRPQPEWRRLIADILPQVEQANRFWIHETKLGHYPSQLAHPQNRLPREASGGKQFDGFGKLAPVAAPHDRRLERPHGH
jgi:Asp-tRNA(Asn)/Glu-tRNA(Gln) amidotransferase A subunit family amidase